MDSEPLDRRHLLGATLGAGALVAGATPAQAATAVPRPWIRTRSRWGADLPVRGTLLREDSVRFLLVHHSASSNSYSSEGARAAIRSFYRLHTGPEKRWPDIAYNFLVDRYGRIWEGRQGSLAGPVRGSATGGSQGHAILCCFIGNHMTTMPTSAAMTAMANLLAWQADLHRINLWAGKTIRFTSRGSNRWPAGTVVTTHPVAGHREMSLTGCPGDALYPRLRTVLLPKVRARYAAYR